MALRFCDSFDHYTWNSFSSDTSRTLGKWDGVNQGASQSTSGHYRFGGGSAQLYNTGYMYKNFDNQPTWILGAAFKTQYSAGGLYPFSLTDEVGGSNQLTVRIQANGQVGVFRNGTLLGSLSAVGTWVDLAWHYVEFKATIDNTAGTYEVRIDGVTIVSGSSVDTQATANAYANRVYVGQPQVNAELNVDDLYICDGTGSSPTNTFLGDVRVEALTPNGNGNYSDFVGSDADSTNNYLLVDEADPNSDTDYVEKDTVSSKDSYAYSNLTSTAGTVYGVQSIPFARKTDAGTKTLHSLARLSGTDAEGPDKVLSTTYLYYPSIAETKPGGGAWTVSDVNSAEFGVKVAA